MKDLLPETIVASGPSWGTIRVTRAMQIAVLDKDPQAQMCSSEVLEDEYEEEDDAFCVPHPHLFAVGDAADAFGAMKAGHTAYYQVCKSNVLVSVTVLMYVR